MSSNLIVSATLFILIPGHRKVAFYFPESYNFTMHVLLSLFFVFISGCSTQWMDKFIRKDYDKIEVTHQRMNPSKLLPLPKKELCTEIKGFSETLLLQDLNRGNTFVFKKCRHPEITITFTSANEDATAKNDSAAKLKSMGSKAKGGNTLLGILLFSSISTDVPVVKAAGTVSVKTKTDESVHKFETEFFDGHYVKSKGNVDGRIDLDLEVLKLVTPFIRSELAPTWSKKSTELTFKIDDPNYEHFKWALNHEEYSRARKLLDELTDLNPPHFHLNRGILNERDHFYEEALRDYETAKFESGITRVKNEIEYLRQIRSLNENLLGSSAR